jgi:S-adenosyl-L-methionine hydrolase (adenosine-forming)
MGAIITLTTDFGLNDGYVAAMKGVIYSINPEATVVDISHNIEPHNIREAAFIFSTAYNFFPSYTVHLVVVDPGVGTNRRAIILKTPKAHFVAPDNGVLSYVIDTLSPQPMPNSGRVTLGADAQVYAITKSEFWRQPVSRTFHGRDIFAPIAARLSLGMMAFSLGDRVDTVTTLPIPHPHRTADTATGQVMHIDNFGNLITNIQENIVITTGQPVNINICDHTIRGLVPTYAEGKGLIALFGSSGYLEISLPNANAAAFLKAGIGDEVTVKPGGN